MKKWYKVETRSGSGAPVGNVYINMESVSGVYTLKNADKYMKNVMVYMGDSETFAFRADDTGAAEFLAALDAMVSGGDVDDTTSAKDTPIECTLEIGDALLCGDETWYISAIRQIDDLPVHIHGADLVSWANISWSDATEWRKAYLEREASRKVDA
jgi:hypothetical protein